MVTPVGLEPHWSRVLLTLGDGNIDIQTYENVITSALGTEIPSKCTNRAMANTAELKLYGAPTLTDEGDVLHTLWAPPTQSQGSHVVGISDISNGEEWIMKEDSTYMMRITNNSGGTIAFSWEMLWLDLAVDE